MTDIGQGFVPLHKICATVLALLIFIFTCKAIHLHRGKLDTIIPSTGGSYFKDANSTEPNFVDGLRVCFSSSLEEFNKFGSPHTC